MFLPEKAFLGKEKRSITASSAPTDRAAGKSPFFEPKSSETAVIFKKTDGERAFLRLNANEMAEKFAEQQNLISQQQNRIESLQNLLSNAYIALAQFYLDGLKTKIIEWHWPGREEPQKNDIMYKILDYFRKAIQCLINSGNRDELLKIMEVFSAKMPTFLKENTELVKKTLLNNPQFFSPSNFFTKDDLSETVGFDNAIYKKFIQRFAFLFDMIDECANNEFRQEEK